MNSKLRSTNLFALLGALLLLPACSPSSDDDDSSSSDDDDTADSVPYEFTPVTRAWMYVQTKTTADGTWICDIDWLGEDRSDHDPFLDALDGATHYFAAEFTLDPESGCFAEGRDSYENWADSSGAERLLGFALVPSATDAALYSTDGTVEWTTQVSGDLSDSEFYGEFFFGALGSPDTERWWTYWLEW